MNKWEELRTYLLQEMRFSTHEANAAITLPVYHGQRMAEVRVLEGVLAEMNALEANDGSDSTYS